MKVIEETYNWAYPLTERRVTTHLILHHAAGVGSAQDIHRIHLANGWSGIGYHYYVRRDGSVYRGRPEDRQGAHTEGWNYCSIGVCFEGNFETETMSEAQAKAGQAMVADIRDRYPGIVIGAHRDYNATACPGRNFPFAEITEQNEPDGSVESSREPSGWAKAACDWAVAEGLFKGDGSGDYRWHDYPTRQELAVVLQRLEEKAWSGRQ